MIRRALSIGLAVMLFGPLIPSAAVGAATSEPLIVQVVPLQYVYVAGSASKSLGIVSPRNRVSGSCGWASLYIYPRGSGYALFAADAGTSYWAPIVFVDWKMDWKNTTAGPNGYIAGQTYQYSWTWSVDIEKYTSTGYVNAKLSKLFVRHQDGTTCVGLYPSDTEWVT